MRFALSFLLLSTFVFASGCDSSSEETGDNVVVAYSGETLTAEDAVVTDGMGFEQEWQAERNGNTVTLKRSELCGDECNETTKLVLRNQERDRLPTFVSLERVRQEYLPEQRKENRLEVKQVEIQDWNPYSGVVSGRVEGEENLVFWYDFSGEPST